jgi:dTDP-4-amino-4,6-dideoxygalactose transaminase
VTAPLALVFYLKESTGKEFCAFEHRASWALMRLLRSTGGEYGHRVALPSFLCHAPIAAAVEAGMEPFFCDVDPLTGAVTDAEWLRAKNNGVRIFLWVHMFGIPRESTVMREASANPNFLVIEDCCLSMGAKLSSEQCGSIGQAALFSFGPTKQANLGAGGAVFVNDQKLIHKYKSIVPLKRTPPAGGEGEYRQFFYDQAATYVTNADRGALSGLIERYRPYLRGAALSDELNAFNPQVFAAALQLRLEKFSLYAATLGHLPWLSILSGVGMTPWRFVFILPLAEPRDQHVFSELLRETGMSVSNWYFPAHLMMPSTSGQKLPGTESLSSSVFQLWLDDKTDLSDIQSNCEKLVETWEKFQENRDDR